MTSDPSNVQQMFDTERRLASLERKTQALNHGGGDGTSGGVTEDWKASVDRQLGQLHEDVRSLLRNGIAAVVALALMIGGLYLYFNVKFEAVDHRLAAIEARQEKLEGKIDTEAAKVNGKLDILLDRKERAAGK